MHAARKTTTIVAMTLCLLALIAGLAQAASFNLIVGEYAASNSSSEERSRAVELSPVISRADVIAQGDSLRLALFPDAVFSATVDRVTENINGTVTVRGRIADYPMAFALISTTSGRTLAEIEIPETGRRFFIESDDSGNHFLSDVTGETFDRLENGPSLIPPADAALLNAPPATLPAMGPLDPATMNVLMVYTASAKSWAGGQTGIDNVIAQAMAKAQLACDNSNTVLTLRLAHSAEVSYTESGSSYTDLNRLTYEDDGYLEEVHTWRDQYNADIVTLLAQVDDTGGLGWLLNTTLGLPDYAFNLCRVQQSGWTYTVVHEQGHNMGCHHAKNQNVQPGPGLFSYSAGWRWVGTNSVRYCDLMTYESGTYFDDGLTHTQVGYFSNPSVNYQGTATGDATDGDNAANVRQIKHVIAAYREADTTPPTVDISAPSASQTTTGPVTYTVTYGGADSVTLSDGDVTLNKTGTADGSVAVSGTGNATRTVTISAITGAGTLGISISAGTASDTTGNMAPSAGPSTTFVVSDTPSAPSSLTASAKSDVRIDLSWTDNADNETGFKIERKTGSTGTWAQIGTTAAGVSTYSSTGLTANTIYYYRVRAYNDAGDSAWSNEANAKTYAVAAPSVLTATAISPAQINLSWTDNSTTETGFKILRKTGASGTYSQIATVGANVTTYNSTGLTANTTYYYLVRAYVSAGDSAYSNQTSATTFATAAPSGLTATAASSTQINLSWTDNSSDETGFRIERKTGSDGTWAEIATVGASVKTYSNTGLTASTQYYYRVRAYTTGGNSAWSNEANATTTGGAPISPNLLTATAISTSQIDLSWTDRSSDETGFQIWRKIGSGGTYSQIATVGANVTTYSNTGLTAATQYYYLVRAYNGGGNSSYSNQTNATTFATAAPSGLTATAASSTQIDLSWTDNSSDETGFRVERKTGSGGTWAEIATVGAGVTTYSSTGLTASTQYYYRVRAYTGSGNSAYSNEANATTSAGGGGLTAPSALTATATSSSQINLSWTDNTTTETGFKIERKTGSGGTWAEITTVGADVTTYSNTGLAASTQYYYRVRAYTATEDSPYSNEANATTTGGAPISPNLLTATAISTSQIDLSWTDRSSDETGFQIWRKIGSGGTYSQIATVGANVTTYSNTGLNAATQYYYLVRAYNGTGNSAFSNQVNATTFATAAPSGLTATAASGTQINLSWTDNSSDETGFRIERKTGSGGTWAEIATVGAGVTTYSSTGLTASTQYYYRVRAYTGSGNSAYSNEANATTSSGSVPISPSALTATAISSTQINLSWTDRSSDETGFQIWRKTGSGGIYSQIATVGANVTTYSSTGLTAGTTYYYLVRAYNGSGNSTYSNQVSSTTP